ncbi:hypothetical protein GIB67_027467 [Kingdonia uniflora]|uniref:Nuclease associated modular domain-containing protein n=1 Tax=Kingdonia uniflora TaxID=39325 RepID=A0A7J7MFN1_9MAGN|nr:hypothetical protein GIB67_027467 [Kingdonia uniflora]
MMQSNYRIQIQSVNKLFRASTFTNVHPLRVLQLGVNVGHSFLAVQYVEPLVRIDSLKDKCYDEEIQVDASDDGSNKELERRRKISVANKGKMPWNKGRKHTAETRERIKQRTIEALRDPKVRKKMSEFPRAHSDEIKTKISVAQRQVWAKRLKWRNLVKKFYMIWAGSIAEAAKRGEHDQQELDWDSYENMEAEIALKQLQWAADKAKLKENAKLRAAEVKAEKIAMRALKRKEKKEQRAKAGEVKKRVRKRSKIKPKLPLSKGLKVKARITKFLKKKCEGNQVVSQGDTFIGHQPNIEKLDLEFIQREKLRGEVSLADQIKAAKKKRTESIVKDTLSSEFLTDERVEHLAPFNFVH